MTKRVDPSVRSLLPRRAATRALPSLVALCLVLLQFATALHFALIPHGFNASGSGFVHVHRWLAGQPASATQPAPNRPKLVTGIPSCVAESCPIGFSGPPSVLLAPSELSGLIALPLVSALLESPSATPARGRVLLSAPKTSPPSRV